MKEAKQDLSNLLKAPTPDDIQLYNQFRSRGGTAEIIRRASRAGAIPIINHFLQSEKPNNRLEIINGRNYTIFAEAGAMNAEANKYHIYISILSHFDDAQKRKLIDALHTGKIIDPSNVAVNMIKDANAISKSRLQPQSFNQLKGFLRGLFYPVICPTFLVSGAVLGAYTWRQEGGTLGYALPQFYALLLYLAVLL